MLCCLYIYLSPYLYHDVGNFIKYNLRRCRHTRHRKGNLVPKFLSSLYNIWGYRRSVTEDLVVFWNYVASLNIHRLFERAKIFCKWNSTFQVCQPRCVCEKWKGYVVKHNYFIVEYKETNLMPLVYYFFIHCSTCSASSCIRIPHHHRHTTT